MINNAGGRDVPRDVSDMSGGDGDASFVSGITEDRSTAGGGGRAPPAPQATHPIVPPPAAHSSGGIPEIVAQPVADPFPRAPPGLSSAASVSSSIVSSLASERMKDGMCPTCGTRLYKLKKASAGKKGSGAGNSLLKKIGVRKGDDLRAGAAGIAPGLKRVPLTIEGEVMRGQCLRCTGGHSGEGEAEGGGRRTMGGPTLAAIPPPISIARLDVRPDDDIPDAQSYLPTAVLAGERTNCQYFGLYNESGQRHGMGELRWENGDSYEGMFWNGMMDGEGTLSFADGTEYVGTWKLNKMDGSGTRRYGNGNVYTGEYRSGKRSGQGRCYFANGDMYVGQWKDDLIEGFGRYHYNNGKAFEGNFRGGKREGRGKFQLLDGRVDIYRYVNDTHVGEGVRWSKDRTKAWRLDAEKGKQREKVTLEEAARIAERCGPVVDYGPGPAPAPTRDAVGFT